jgi:aminoglycoside phosphotransferase (APT) family kinase protein
VAFDEPLDIEDESSLLRYLRATDRIAPDETPRTSVLAGGVSNRTVLVERPSGESWVLKQALPKLRTQADWFSDPSRIRREAEALRWLPKFAPPGTITPLVFEDPAHYVLAMQAVPQPHENWKAMLLACRMELNHVEQFAVILGSIHRRAMETGEEVRHAFGDRSFFESLRVEPYYQYTALRVPEAAEFLYELIRDTRERQLSLVHGDFSPKNILVHDGWLVLLDHEVIHWGDPAFDVGFALTHLLSKLNHLRCFASLFLAARTFGERYGEAVGDTLWNADSQSMAGRHLLACLLARVAGRSPLEYLTEPQRQAQRDFAVRMMRRWRERRSEDPLDRLIWLARYGTEDGERGLKYAED